MPSPVEPYSLPFSRPACFRGFGGVAVWVGVVPIGYDDVVAAMEARVAGIAAAWAGCRGVLGQDAFFGGDFKVPFWNGDVYRLSDNDRENSLDNLNFFNYTSIFSTHTCS